MAKNTTALERSTQSRTPTSRARALRAGVLIAAASASFAAVVRAQDASSARQVAAPASDIVSGVVRLPDPASTPTISPAASLPLHFEREASGNWVAELVVPVDSPGALTFALLSPDAGTWKLSVTPPTDSLRAIPARALRPIEEQCALVRRVQAVGDEMPGWMVDRYDLEAAPAGMWSVHVETVVPRRTAPTEGWLVERTSGELRIETHVTTLELVSDEPIGIVARIVGGANNGESGRGELVERAELVLDVDGRTQRIELHDDGEHLDGLPDDGVFGALLPQGTLGQVRAHVELAGSTASGQPFLRTADLAFPVLQRAVFLEGPARASMLDPEHLTLELDALPLVALRRLHVSAEVWGHTAGGESVPVCWLSKQVFPQEHAGVWTLGLVLDTGWLAVAQATTPLELREVRVQDPDSEIVFDRVAHLRLLSADITLPSASRSTDESLPSTDRSAGSTGSGADRSTAQGSEQGITSEMLTGGTSLMLSATQSSAHTRTNPSLFSPGLMLVHGYCSSGSIWPAADFTQPKVEFLDPNANRTHDQFAQLIAQKAQASGLSSFGVVAHSQGGAAALHLLTYYTSGLDFAQGPHRIQSLASPYQGTPLASLGFFSCGVNNDMTYAGSATWLAGIPTWARNEVYYWTTSDAGSACNFLTNLLLTNPEDGVVEQAHCALPSGHSMGHVTGWCHTTGMTYPASYTDHTRNQAMNSAAAR